MLKISRSGQQFAAVMLALTVIGAILYGPNAIHGGFLSDAWADRADYVFASKSGFFGGVSRFMEEPNVAVRPLLAVYLSAVNAVFGGHMGFWLGWLIATNIAMCAVLYLLLRRLSMAAIDAAAVAVLVFIFPATGSLRLWSAMLASPVTITLALTGFLLALVAFDCRNRRWSLGLHLVSLMFFASSVLLYELALPVMLLSVLVYRLKVGWRPAIYRWLVDCVVLLTIALTVTRSSESGFMQSYGGMFDHAREIYGQLPTLLTKVVLPFGSSRWYISLLLALVPLTGAVIYRLLPEGAELRVDLRRWGLVMAAGVIIILAGYTIFIPALSYYVPLRVGIANRINAVPSIGWVLLFYGGARMIGAIVFQGVPDDGPGLLGRRRLGQALAVVGCALVALGWVKTLHAESDSYTGAFKEDLRVLASIQSAIPDPTPEGTIWTFGQPVLYAPEIPVFGNTWDMTTAVQLQYDDPSLTSYVALPETVFDCGPKEIKPGGPGYLEPEASALASPYGRTYFIDTNTGEAVKIDSQAECLRAASSFVPSPFSRE
jgi:hypothetical protein